MAFVSGTSASELIQVAGVNWQSLFPSPPLVKVSLATNSNDTIFAGDGDDVVISGDGTDSVDGGGGNDFIGPQWLFILYGGAEVVDTDSNLGFDFDTVGGGDVLVGSAGNDTIVAGYDAIVDGGADMDLAYLNLGSMWVHHVGKSILETQNDLGMVANLGLADAGTVVFAVGGLGNLTISVTDVEAFHVVFGWGDDNIIGGAFSDSLWGNWGNDSLHGAGGDDYLGGDSGSDLLMGGDGDDVLVHSNDSGSTYGWLVDDRASDILHGGAGNDTLSGAIGDTLDGGAGTDHAWVYLGTSNLGRVADLRKITAPAGLDLGTGTVLRGIEYVAQIEFGFAAGNDRITTSAQRSGVVNLGGGNDTLTFFGRPDANTYLDGGAGTDTLILSGDFSMRTDLGWPFADGFEKIILRAGNDYWLRNLVWDDIRVRISGEALGAADTLRVDGTPRTNGFTAIGGAGADSLTGGDGRDTLTGGAGDDLIQGGRRGDMVTGGDGADRFRFGASNEGGDAIADFVTGVDVIEVVRGGFLGGLQAGMDLLAAGRFVEGAVANAARGQFLYDATTGTLRWDIDGTGTRAAVILAELGAGTALDAADIVVIA